MTASNNPILGRGESSTSSILGKQVGIERCFDDIDYSDNTRRSHHPVRCRLVKNSAAGALLPKATVSFKTGTSKTEVDGSVTLTAANEVAVADEWLPAAGVPASSYFWVVVHGPSEVLTPMEGDALNLIPEGTVLVGLTAITSGSTTAGRATPQDLTGATAVLGLQLNGAFGRAMSAKTTANTNTGILAFITTRWD